MKNANGEIIDGEIDEVSVVSKPANKKRFLFMKAEDMKNEFKDALDMRKEDGTIKIELSYTNDPEDITLTVNGKRITKLDTLFFSMSPSYEDPKVKAVDCMYSTRSDARNSGFEERKTYILRKGDSSMLNELVQKQMKNLFGDDFEFVKMEMDENTFADLAKALEVVNNYSEDLPEDLSVALTDLTKYAVSGYGVKKVEETAEIEGEDNTEKSEEKTETPEKEDKEKSTEAPEKEKETNATEVDKSAEEISKIAGMIDKVVEAINGMEKRLEVVEKSTGTRKSITEGEETTEEENPVKSYPSLWKGKKD